MKAHLVRHLTDTHGLVLPTLLGSGSGSADSPLSVLSASGSAVKTRAAFCLVTTVLTRVSRQLCKNVLNVRRSARCPFRPINITAIKQECKSYPFDDKCLLPLCICVTVFMYQLHFIKLTES